MKRLFLILPFLLILAGCRKDIQDVVVPDEEQVTDNTFMASLEGGVQEKWLAGDMIKVFSTSSTDGEAYSFIGSGSFVRKGGGEADGGTGKGACYAVYPYDERAALASDGTISLYLPEVQPYLRNDIAQHVNTMVAVTGGAKDRNLMFQNVCGYVKVKLVGNFIARKVTLTGNMEEPLSGPAKVKAVKGSIPTVTMEPDAGKEIVIDCGKGVALSASTAEATSFWFVVPPVKLSKGFTVTAEDMDGNVYVRTVSTELVVERSSKGIPMMEMSLTKPENISNPLKFVSTGANTISIVKEGAPVETAIEYSSKGDKWETYEFGAPVELSDGECVYFRAATKMSGFSRDAANHYRFKSSGSGTLAASGNIISLVDPKVSTFDIPSDGCFHSLFKGMTNLTDGPTLPDGSLKPGCYAEMFSGCSSLSYVRGMFKTAPGEEFTSGWMSGVAADGIFVMNPDASWRNEGPSGIPAGWYVWDFPEDDDPVAYSSVDYLRPNPNMGSNHVQANQMNEDDPTEWTFYTTGTDPYIPIEGLRMDAQGPIFVFQYKSTSAQRFELFWCPGGYPNQLAGGRETPFMVEEAAEWKVCKVDMSESWEKFGWPGKVGDGVRFDIGGSAGQTIVVRLMHWRARTPFD